MGRSIGGRGERRESLKSEWSWFGRRLCSIECWALTRSNLRLHRMSSNAQTLPLVRGYFTCLHVFRSLMSEITMGTTPNWSAISRCDHRPVASMRRIRRTSLSRSNDVGLFSPRRRPVLPFRYCRRTDSLWLTHRRFVARLHRPLPFLWITQARRFGFATNAFATRR